MKKTVNKMAIQNPYLSINTFNVMDYSPTKRQKVTGWIKEKRPKYMLPKRDSLQLQGHM